jgi:hypothetical protein
VKGKYFQPITSTAPKITTTTEIDLTFTWSSKKCYNIMLPPSKSTRFMSLRVGRVRTLRTSPANRLVFAKIKINSLHTMDYIQLIEEKLVIKLFLSFPEFPFDFFFHV